MSPVCCADGSVLWGGREDSRALCSDPEEPAGVGSRARHAPIVKGALTDVPMDSMWRAGKLRS